MQSSLCTLGFLKIRKITFSLSIQEVTKNNKLFIIKYLLIQDLTAE